MKVDITSSWVDLKVYCKECGSMIVVCQSKDKDYHYYCSQKLCKNHEGIELYDDEEYPDFVKEAEWNLILLSMLKEKETK